MYTVFRFYCAEGETGHESRLREVGRMANDRLPGFFAGMDRIERQFSGSVANSNKWSDHVELMIRFLEIMSSVIVAAREKSIQGQFDVAVDNDDCPEAVISSLIIPHELLAKLTNAGVELVFSVYWPPSRDDALHSRKVGR